jgi:hypothetical protein
MLPLLGLLCASSGTENFLACYLYIQVLAEALMATYYENNGQDKIAIREDGRELQAYASGTSKPGGPAGLEGPDVRPDSVDGREALAPGLIEDQRLRLDSNSGSPRDQASGGVRRYRRINKRTVLIGLVLIVIGAVAPFAWNYLQSYQSTDDAQIDGHIDPLSSRIDGTVVGVHAEDDDRVTRGGVVDRNRSARLRGRGRAGQGPTWVGTRSGGLCTAGLCSHAREGSRG